MTPIEGVRAPASRNGINTLATCQAHPTPFCLLAHHGCRTPLDFSSLSQITRKWSSASTHPVRIPIRFRCDHVRAVLRDDSEDISLRVRHVTLSSVSLAREGQGHPPFRTFLLVDDDLSDKGTTGEGRPGRPFFPEPDREDQIGTPTIRKKIRTSTITQRPARPVEPETNPRRVARIDRDTHSSPAEHPPSQPRCAKSPVAMRGSPPRFFEGGA